VKPQLQLLPPVFSREVAAVRWHIDCIIEGEDIDPESGAHHLGHVAAGCAIVLDARKAGTLEDNRPPRI